MAQLTQEEWGELMNEAANAGIAPDAAIAIPGIIQQFAHFTKLSAEQSLGGLVVALAIYARSMSLATDDDPRAARELVKQNLEQFRIMAKIIHAAAEVVDDHISMPLSDG